MKRPAFTLIEVVAVLSIFIAVSLGGLWLSRRVQNILIEDRFFEALQAHWQNTLVQARGQGGGVQFTNHTAIFYVGNPQRAVRLTIPATFERTEATVVVGSEMFTQPKTVMLRRPTGSYVRITFQMGWGELDIQR
ncbi:hypothetical protein [Lacticaseibacillus brantae]|uniref:Prepilin-type N-terminal cleavage/methylation domain-containing protein n=1 Tax=Lacticaseibacillus brantae DSM 23927 TaxID=1423727 RepID=A0A0R2B148_9LACO|nr:hypothetical protein [Lacticaseibacillus brantae]KRM73056.1 hypothetical protein FC34_GL000777 [Lacticaseibacillus brantae DSM 23927]